MKAQTIEKLDKARFNSWLVQTIGFGLFLGMLILHQITGNESTTLFIATAVGVVVFVAGVLWKGHVTRQIRSNSAYNKALNNELYIQYGYKTYYWGFFAMILTLLILLFAVRRVDLGAQLLCLIPIYTGVLVQKTSMLIYYGKNG